MTRHGPQTAPTDRPIHPAAAWLIVLGAVLVAWVAVLALVLGALVIAGTWGLVGLVLALACVWVGVRVP